MSMLNFQDKPIYTSFFSSGTFFSFHISLLKCYFDLVIWGSIFQSNYFWLTGLALTLARMVDFPQGRSERDNSEAAEASSKLKSQSWFSWHATTLLYLFFLSLSFVCPIELPYEIMVCSICILVKTEWELRLHLQSVFCEMMHGAGPESGLYVRWRVLGFPSLPSDIGILIISICMYIYI